MRVYNPWERSTFKERKGKRNQEGKGVRRRESELVWALEVASPNVDEINFWLTKTPEKGPGGGGRKRGKQGRGTRSLGET